MDILYEKMTQREHIYKLPDSYVGSVIPISREMDVFNEETGKIVQKLILYNPGLYKIFDEIIVNSCDQSRVDKLCNKIAVTIDGDVISVWNNGSGIDPNFNKKETALRNPSLIFGELLTSSNYSKKDKTIGGKNGYGAKLTNIFSKSFEVETGHPKSGLWFYQKWTENMTEHTAPGVKQLPKTKGGFVRITFLPDYKRLGCDGMSDDMKAMFEKRLYDAALCCPDVHIEFNGKVIPKMDMKKYVDLYYNTPPDKVLTYKNDRWNILVAYNCASVTGENNKIVSFVNGIWTYDGGTHVTAVQNAIMNALKDKKFKTLKDAKINPRAVFENFDFFIEVRVNDPAFSTQGKGKLDTSKDKLPPFDIPLSSVIKFISSTDIVKILEEMIGRQQARDISKIDRNRGLVLPPKLSDAADAGPGSDCTLIIVEGDSAKTFADAGISIIGHNKYGVFPIKGKFINVRNKSIMESSSNEEFIALRKILGLELNKKPNPNTMRYRRLLVLTDQDPDGSHIKGLIMNMLEYCWVDLMTRPEGFVFTLNTPIVKLLKPRKNYNTKPEVVEKFYSVQEYEEWKCKHPNHKYTVKYYKGLGTSTNAEAKECFHDFDDHVVKYTWNPEPVPIDEKLVDVSLAKPVLGGTKNVKMLKDGQYITQEGSYKLLLGFSKLLPDDRKEWLIKYDPCRILDYTRTHVSVSEFIDNDMIHFSNYDNERSIPCFLDGFKPSQRKILHTMISKFARVESIKVAELASTTSGFTSYHHGEASLEQAIVKMAQNFPGANNINLLAPEGNFGNRTVPDSSQSRYIFTRLETVTRKIFRPEDDFLLEHIMEETQKIEPKSYYPILPMILVNGSVGIGTGYSVSLPSFNPLEISACIKRRLKGGAWPDLLKPWIWQFNGTIECVEKDGGGCDVAVRGVYTREDETIKVTEIPITPVDGTVPPFTTNLQKYCEPETSGTGKQKELTTTQLKKILVDRIVNGSRLNTISVNVLLTNVGMSKTDEELEKSFGLCEKYSINTIYLQDINRKVVKFNSAVEILKEWFVIRLEIYKLRHRGHMELLEHRMKVARFRIKFLELMIAKKYTMDSKDEAVIKSELLALGFPRLHITSPHLEGSYDYLIGIPLASVSKQSLERYRREADAAQAEYDRYKNLTPGQLWIAELDEFEKDYAEYEAYRIESAALDGSAVPDDSVGKVRRKRRTVGVKKS